MFNNRLITVSAEQSAVVTWTDQRTLFQVLERLLQINTFAGASGAGSPSPACTPSSL